VAVGERVPLAWLDPLQRDADLLRVEVTVGEACLLDLAEPLRRGHVLHLSEVLDRVVH
jgi:hypothetical protein